MFKFLAENRVRFEQEMAQSAWRKYFSATLYDHDSKIKKQIKSYARGSVLDVGSGSSPFKGIIIRCSEKYDTFDREQRDAPLTYLGDIHSLSKIVRGSYDTIICFEVLEHVQEPEGALREIREALSDGGTLLMSVPHISRLHEEPHDYYRFTKYGLKYLLTKNSFQVIAIVPYGGLFSFFSHQWSSFFILVFWRVPVLKYLAMFFNIILFVLTSYFLDTLLDRRKIFAQGYICIAKKLPSP